MKKIVLWLMSTLTVLVLLFGYHTSTSSRASASGDSSVLTPVTSGTGSTSTGTSGTTSSGTSGTASGGTSGTASGTASGGTSSSASGGSGTTGSSSGAASSSSTVTGDVADTRWGPVQVQLTVQAKKITDVAVVQYPNGNGRDQEINSYALPQLIQETMQAQSANIDMISGATVTSDGYLQSLQSALDKAGL